MAFPRGGGGAIGARLTDGADEAEALGIDGLAEAEAALAALESMGGVTIRPT